MSRVVTDAEKRVTQAWGNGGHGGIDIGFSSKEENNKVYANCKGAVVEVVDGLDRMPNSNGVASWGNYVLVKHPNGIHTRYAHLQKGLPVRKGQEVDENTILGIIGESGNTFGRHLHFEVAKGYSSSTRIDPTPYLTKAVYEESKKEEKPISNKKSIEEIAKEVIAGKWGNGVDRKNKLTACGYNYNEVQNKVNEMLSISKKTETQKYTVKPGDTVSAICNLFYKRSTKAEWDKIKNANNLNNSYLIKEGQVLIIP